MKNKIGDFITVLTPYILMLILGFALALVMVDNQTANRADLCRDGLRYYCDEPFQLSPSEKQDLIRVEEYR